MSRLGFKKTMLHYKCKKCGFVINKRELHLDHYHFDVVDYETIRNLELDDPELQKILQEWFEETNEPYTQSIYILNKNWR